MSAEESKKALLKHTFPDLTDEMLEHVASAARVTTYPTDVILCHEDKIEDVFYIIIEGEVGITKKMGEVDHLMRKGVPGQFFGELALLDERIGRSATVTTTETTTVLEIDRSTFNQVIKKTPELVLAMTKIIIQRMRENDRQALLEFRAQQREIQDAYEALQKLDEQRHLFLTTLAHELRTPLTSVMGYMQLVRGGHVEGPALKMSLDKIGGGLNRLASLINDLMFVQQIEGVDVHFEDTDVSAILSEVVADATNYATEQKANLKLSVDPQLPHIKADAAGLKRAFGHLIDNAIKFSPEGGDVGITATKLGGDLIEVIVQDHGVGIDPEFRPRLFQLFERDEKYGRFLFGGVGLGMPIVKYIVDSHGGRIDVESVRGKGAKFRLEFPLDANRASLEISIDDAWVDA